MAVPEPRLTVGDRAAWRRDPAHGSNLKMDTAYPSIGLKTSEETTDMLVTGEER